MVQWGRYLPSIVDPFDKILGSAMSLGLEVLGIIDSIKASKSMLKALLDAGYSLVINKINLRPSKGFTTNLNKQWDKRYYESD